MPNLVSTLEGTIARAGSQLGVWWPNLWWPTGNSKYNDCAAFVSWCLWGLNGNQPYQTVVSGVVERSGLEFHAGAAGIRRGDVAGFRWTNASNYDHTELVLSSPSPLGMIQTIGANGGGSDKVAIHTRSTGYVHNYARPSYPGISQAGGGGTAFDNQEIEMSAPFVLGFIDTGVTYSLTPGIISRHGEARQREMAVAQAGQTFQPPAGHPELPAGPAWYGDDDFARVLWMYSILDLPVATIKKWTAYETWVSASLRPAAPALTAAQLAAIGAGVKVPTPDFSALVAQIAALDKQADDYQAQVEALIKAGFTGTITIAPKS